MKYFNFLTLFIYIGLSLIACSENQKIFPKSIEKEPGALAIKNPSAFMGSVSIGNSFDHELKLQATGGLDLSDIGVTITTSDPITFLGGTYPGRGGTCSLNLKSGEVCSIIVNFQPTTIASHQATLSFSYKDLISSKQMSYILSADSHPILTFDYGSQYDFGNKFLSSSTDLKIKVSNTGRVDAENISINNLAAPFTFKGGVYPGTGGTCGSRVTVGQSCDIVINYLPTNKGQHLQDIVLSYLNSGRTEKNTLHLIAWGFVEAQLTLDSVSGDSFGTIASNFSSVKTYVLTHSNGDVSANLISIANLPAPFSRTGGTCGAVLSASQHSCTIDIALNASSAGSWSSPFSLTYNNGRQVVSISKTLTGVTKAKPILLFTPLTTADYGIVKVGSSKTLSFTLQYVSGDLPATGIALSTQSAPFSKTGGTCTSTLSSGSCTIMITFSPTTHNVWSSPISISYNDNISTVTSPVINLVAASDSLLSSSSLSFGTVVAGRAKDLTVSLNFSGGTPATNISVQSITGPYNFTSGSYPGSISSTCKTTLSSGSCVLSLTFAPLMEGNFNSNKLTLQYNNGVDISTLIISLNGTGTPAALLTMEGKDYGTASLNSAVPGPSLIKITNSTAMTATSMSSALPLGFSYKGGSFPGTNSTPSVSLCGTSLSGGASCYINVLFTPLVASNYSGTLNLSYNDGTGTASTTSTLSGVGEATSDLFISSYDLVSFLSTYVGNTPQTIVLTLTQGGGSDPVSITSKTISSADYSITASTCTTALSNGQKCTLTLAFNPSTAGTKLASLDITYETGGITKNTSRLITGAALTPASLSVSPASYDFGSLLTSANYDKTFTITRSGSYSPTSFSSQITGTGFTFKGGAYPGTGGSCPTSTSISSTCTVVVTFNPTSEILYSGQMKITYSNGFQNTTTTVVLNGSGKPSGKLTFSSASYDFGKVIQTTTAEKTITMTNTGTIAIPSLSPPILSAPFGFKGGTYPGTGGTCGSSLTTSQICTMVISFAPTDTGVKNQNLIVSYENGSGTTQSQTAITGEGLAQAIISISEISPYNFGTTNINGKISVAFTLTNAGSVSGTNLTGTFVSAFNYLDGGFPGTGGTCQSKALPAGTSCTVILSFSPTATLTYNGSFALTYYDGLKSQTELKEFIGTGSLNLYQNYYFSLIQIKSFTAQDLDEMNKAHLVNAHWILDVNKNGHNDILVSTLNIGDKKTVHHQAIDGQSHKTIYKIQNILPVDHYRGLAAISLKQDINGDHHPEILFGIYLQEDNFFNLVGFDIISASDGHILKRYLSIEE